MNDHEYAYGLEHLVRDEANRLTHILADAEFDDVGAETYVYAFPQTTSAQFASANES